MLRAELRGTRYYVALRTVRRGPLFLLRSEVDDPPGSIAMEDPAGRNIAHTEVNGTYVPNDEDDEVLYGVIDKIMSMFD